MFNKENLMYLAIAGAVMYYLINYTEMGKKTFNDIFFKPTA